jgi:hypothetical protein
MRCRRFSISRTLSIATKETPAHTSNIATKAAALFPAVAAAAPQSANSRSTPAEHHLEPLCPGASGIYRVSLLFPEPRQQHLYHRIIILSNAVTTDELIILIG